MADWIVQTIGTFSSAHVAPPAAIQTYLSTPAAQAALPASAYSPQSTQYNQLQLYNQLEGLGELVLTSLPQSFPA